MEKSDLLPPHQIAIAGNALLGDPASQRAVLELVVVLTDAGIEPVDVFKKAALESLRVALANNKLQSRRNAKIKGGEGKEFSIAVLWWKEKLGGHPKVSTSVEQQLDPTGNKNLKPAINRAVKLHGKLAKERALFELVWGGPDGPNLNWVGAWESYRIELMKPAQEAIDKLKLPEETAKLLKR